MGQQEKRREKGEERAEKRDAELLGTTTETSRIESFNYRGIIKLLTIHTIIAYYFSDE